MTDNACEKAEADNDIRAMAIRAYYEIAFVIHDLAANRVKDDRVRDARCERLANFGDHMRDFLNKQGAKID